MLLSFASTAHNTRIEMGNRCSLSALLMRPEGDMSPLFTRRNRTRLLAAISLGNSRDIPDNRE